MLRMGLFLATVLVPVQIFFGHLTGEYVHHYQPAKFAAIEARWHDEQPAGEVLIALPDPAADNEQLEFVGDAVLGLAVAESLFRRFPTSREGELTRLRSSLVSLRHLGDVAARIACRRANKR